MRRIALALVAILAAVPTASVLAQPARGAANPAGSTTPAAGVTAARPDSAARTSAATAAPARRGLLARAARAVEQTTGLSAGETTGGAARAARLAEAAAELSPTVRLARSIKAAGDRQQQQERDEVARAQEGERREAAMATLERLAATSDDAAAGRPAASGGATPGDDVDAELRALQARQSRLLSRAGAGDTAAANGLLRMQLELGDFALRAASLPPGQQAAAAVVALRSALACAETGHGCRRAR
jgi:hypothetical protein